MTLLTTSIFAGPYCIDNEEHFIKCPCNCDTIKGRHCIDCAHLQDARPITVVEPTQRQMYGSMPKAYTSEDPKHTLEKLAAQYVKHKYDV